MKQKQLTDLALRKIYHAEQLGLEAPTVEQMRGLVRSLNGKLDHATQYIDQEAAMLVTALAAVGLAASEWTRTRVKSPGGLKLGRA
jgi:Flp pilus assembly protein TadD